MKNLVSLLLVLFAGVSFAQDFSHLKEGEKAIDFNLKSINGEEIQLSEINDDKPVVLVVLRGFPEYQCPICSRQVGSLLMEEENFAKSGAAVIMVYPGLANKLDDHASEFTSDFEFPDNYYFTLDPDYAMINKYGLRWDAPKETAYPSTFVIDKQGLIIYSKISLKHGGRSKTNDILEVL